MKLKFKLFAIIYFPMALLWSILYGVPIGIIGKSVGYFEDFIKKTKVDFKAYKTGGKKRSINYMSEALHGLKSMASR